MTATLEELSAVIAGLQAEIALLRAKDDLRDLVVTYARGCDQGNDPALLRPLFTDDATWECKGYGRYVGGDMVAAGLHAVAGNSIFWSLHNMISPHILLDADGQGATLFWYLWEAATLPHDETGLSEAHWIGGTYDARARKVDGTWRFSALELKLDMATPFTKGWVEQRFPRGSNAQRYFAILEPGDYKYCACGQSKTQPFCDGTHEGGSAEPIPFTIDRRRTVALCGCRKSRTKPFCDATHLGMNKYG
jgi:CDGSH-type Zn-finger protein